MIDDAGPGATRFLCDFPIEMRVGEVAGPPRGKADRRFPVLGAISGRLLEQLRGETAPAQRVDGRAARGLPPVEQPSGDEGSLPPAASA